MLKQVIVYAIRPGAGLSTAFDVNVVHDDAGGALSGTDIERLGVFLKSHPSFELEWDGKALSRCRTEAVVELGAIRFTHGGMSLVERVKGSPLPNS
jgi:hypothetical protein